MTSRSMGTMVETQWSCLVSDDPQLDETLDGGYIHIWYKHERFDVKWEAKKGRSPDSIQVLYNFKSSERLEN